MIWFHKAKISGITILAGTAITRAAVVIEDAGTLGIGSIYISTVGGKVYVKVAHAEAETYWELVTHTAAD